MREYRVTKDDDGIKLHKWLRKTFPALPLSAVFRSLRTKKVRLNGKHAKGEEVLTEGDTLKIYIELEKETVESPVFKPSPQFSALAKKTLPIVYEDEDILCVNKPAGISVHPGTGTSRGKSLIELITGLYPKETPRLVHRIDKDTSGAILIARHGKALRILLAALTAGEFEKKYLALVFGNLKEDKGVIELSLKRHDQGTKMRTGSGKKAVTKYVVIKRYMNVTLVEAEPVTGRTHQIRAHFAALGHPLCGDSHYGDFAKNREFQKQCGLSRHFLHATSVSFPHPTSGERIEVKAELSEDLSTVLSQLENPSLRS